MEPPRTTLLLVKMDFSVEDPDNTLLKVYCPICGHYCNDESDVCIEDYVGDNILVTCPNRCLEVMLCPGLKPRPDSIKIKYGYSCIYESYPFRDEWLWLGCGQFMETDAAKAFIVNRGWVVPENIEKHDIYEIGVLRITHLDSNYDEDIDQYINYTELPGDIRCFGDVPEHISTDHGGIDLRYKGVCLKCLKCYENIIWGD